MSIVVQLMKVESTSGRRAELTLRARVSTAVFKHCGIAIAEKGFRRERLRRFFPRLCRSPRVIRSSRAVRSTGDGDSGGIWRLGEEHETRNKRVRSVGVAS